MADIRWPPANLPLSGDESVPVLQGGAMRGAPSSSFGGSGPTPPSGLTTFPSYAAIRVATIPAATTAILLNDPQKGGLFIRGGTLSDGTTVQRDDGGYCIHDAGGNPWVRDGVEFINALWYYNAPTGLFGDSSTLAAKAKVTAADQAANPQWIGMPDQSSATYPVGTTWDYVALQEWLYACSAVRSAPGAPLWNIQFGGYKFNVPGYCPSGLFSINQQLACIGTGLWLEWSSRRGSVITWWGNKLGTDNTQPAFLFNSLDYSTIKNLTITDAVGSASALLSIDHNPNVLPYAGGLSPQLNSFYDLFIGGGFGALGIGYTYCGIAIALVGGGSAQGDTQQFFNMFIGGCQNGVIIGGDNAIAATFFGGNMTNCTRGIANIGAGSFTAINLLTEGDVYNYYQTPIISQPTMDGADFYSSEVSTENSTVIGNRSESMVFGVDSNQLLEVQNSAIAFAGTGPWQANAHWRDGFLIGVTGNGFTTAVLADDGGPPLFLGIVDASGLVVTCASSFTGSIANGVLTVTARASGAVSPPQIITGAGVPAGVQVLELIAVGTPDGFGAGGPGTYRLIGAPPTLNVPSTTMTGSPNWTPNQWQTIGGQTAGIYYRFGSNGYTVSGGVASNTANSITLSGPIGIPSGGGPSTLQYPLGYKLFGSSGATAPNWTGVLATQYGRTTRFTPGYLWTTTLGSNFIQGNAPPVGAWAMVCGALNLNLQAPSPMFNAPLFGKVNATFPAASFQGYITGGVLTVTSMTSGTIQINTTVSGGAQVVSQVSGTPGGIGTYNVTPPTMFPLSAGFWATIDNGAGAPGNILTVQQLYSGTLAVGQTIAGQGVTGTPQITALGTGTGGVGTYTIGGPAQLMARIWTESGVAGTVSAMTSSAGFTLVDNQGNPVNAGIAMTNTMGYWGNVTDSALTWIPLDFDVLYGCKRVRGFQGVGGKARNCGTIELDGALPQSVLTSSVQWLADTALNGGPTYDPRTFIGLSVAAINATAGAYTAVVGQAGLGGPRTLYYNVGAATTINFPLLETNLMVDHDLIFQATGAAPVITWGTGVRAAAATLTLGAVNQITKVHAKWWGTLGVWIITDISGPM